MNQPNSAVEYDFTESATETVEDSTFDSEVAFHMSRI